ncbi:2-dehydropantoate 2-reductase [Enterovirga rhinocerotis]|uniref:2-dehydropantoate 2-reductase n=1 Tax=Enterovirga rhinocerotis TaxID=1339210 RepID=A0A4R7BNY2_9HYPH|nr:2-dehydropantoate 2-reductase [Enterovirga rhinocerotis]TDR87250.1 ketopantoate reductase [Enterovirga rhinocerotis]
MGRETDGAADHVAVIGSGGIGGYVAASLAEAGRKVTLCVRTPFDRLTVEEGGTVREVPLPITADPAGIAPARWILLTTKSQDTASAFPWIEALARPGSTLVVIQNGVGHVERAAPIAGPAAVQPAIIWCSVERRAPGEIVHHGAKRIAVPAGEDAAALAGLFAGTGFAIEPTEDFVTVAWRKLLSNLVANALTALTLRRTSLFREPQARDLARQILEEAVAVAQAEGAKLTADDLERALAALGTHGADAGTSMLYDRLSGRPLEHRYVTGALLEAADRHGIAVPVNRTLYALLETVSGQKLSEVR